jgi:hypothetical protein
MLTGTFRMGLICTAFVTGKMPDAERAGLHPRRDA